MSTGDSAKHAAHRSLPDRPLLTGGWRPAWTAGRPVPGRPAFRAWRHGRPFAGGLLLALAGIELLAIPLSGVLSHGAIKLVVYIGIGGVFGVLIGALLITAGIAVWVNPAHRVFYGVAGVALGILSFPASNLGGFFLCMLLAIVGGSLAFAWTPAEPGPTRTVPGLTNAEPGPAGYAAASQADADRGDAGQTPPYGNRMLAVALPLMLAAGLAAAAGGAATAGGAPAAAQQTCILGIICVGGGSSSSPSPSASPTPTCLPTALPTSLPTSLPTDLPTDLPKCLPTALPTPSLPITVPAPSLPGVVPTVAGLPGASPAPKGKPAKGKAKSSAASAGLVAPAAISVITADSVSLSHFTYQGNAKLPTASGGTLTMMKFTASSLTLSGHVADAITEAGVTAVTSSPVMAFDGNVVLYATRLSGRLAGVPLTFTPDTISSVLLTVSNLLTSNAPVTLTSVTTDQATATADSLTYGPGGGGFSVTLH